MSAPRVLMVCQFFRPVVGGAERQAEKLAHALLRRGIHVEVLTPRMDPAWPAVEHEQGLTIRRFALRDLSSIRGIRGVSVINALYMHAQIRRELATLLPRFDVVHTHIANTFASLVAAASKGVGTPVVCKVASGGESFDLDLLKSESLAGPLLRRRMIRAVDRWVAISEEIADSLVGAGVSGRALVRIPNGVGLPPADSERRGATARRFLYLGRFSRSRPRRDFDSLLQGFETLLADVPDCELRLVGGGDLAEELQRRIAALPRARARARVVGYSEPDRWLGWADVLVQPSYAEGLSNALLEGMAAGLACIATGIPPNREVLDDGCAGVVVPLENAAAMAGAMRRLATVPGEAERLGRLARRRVEAVYAIDRVAERYEALYRELAVERSTG